MKIKCLALLSTVSLSIIPLTAFADLTLVNNTASPATASVTGSPCSSAAGNLGILQPHGGKVVVKDWILNMYCKNGCTGHVYMNRNCSGKSIATVMAKTSDGVTSVSDVADGYKIAGMGKSVSIEGGPSRKWYQLFF